MTNLESLHACNPSFAIVLPKEDHYYVDLAAAKGDDVVKRMRRAIALSPNKPTCQLLSGHIGSGKSTELLRLKYELELQGFAVIHCAADKYLQIDDVGLTEIWLMLLTAIVQQLESKGDSLSLAYLPNAISEIEKWMRLPSPIGISTYVPRLQRILQALQDSEQHRRQLQHYFESRIKNPLLVAIEEVTGTEIDRLKHLGKKGLVILVDNLDRLSLEQAKIIFGEGGKYLRQFQCHIIYTMPLLAIIHSDEQFQQRFQKYLKGNAPIILSNLQLRDRLGVVNPESLNLLRQVVLARMLPNIAPEKWLERVTDCFDRLETLDCLCLESHGHLPYLLSILQGCLQSQNPPISLETLNQVLETDRMHRLSTISDRDRQTLQQCLNRDYVLTPEVINLCRRRLLFEHHDDSGSWFSSPFV
ncbi:ATP-binding protein [Pseudanabaena sp. 'Roaring Creek']|uniref:ATP-binding protein n=1 Tax=Pseudanabaena sp. 'Roaring Creek' TaxID=1681830 RepID=UPI0006D858E0|nr:ATP-binding protein [Pseudanabaena sp. 'Roaring Creek']